MTTPTDPSRPTVPTVAEIAALTARLRDLTARGAGVDPAERAGFLADKHALLDRIAGHDESAADVGGGADEPTDVREPWTASDAAAPGDDGDGHLDDDGDTPPWSDVDERVYVVSWAVAARDLAIDRGDWDHAARFSAHARTAIDDAADAGISPDELARELDYPGAAAQLDGDHIDTVIAQHAGVDVGSAGRYPAEDLADTRDGTDDVDGPVRHEDWVIDNGPLWPVLPDWVLEQAARVEAELAAGNALAARPDDLGELAERIGELRAAHGPARTEETLTGHEAVERLTALGYDRASAQVMVGEYLDQTSRAVGVSVHPWGLDQYDVDAIAEQYRWISVVGDHGLTNLAQAREIAAARAESYADEVATVGSQDDPDAAAAVTNLAHRWAERARVPEPFTPVDATSDDAGRWDAPAAAETSAAAERAFDELRQRYPPQEDEDGDRLADRRGADWVDPADIAEAGSTRDDATDDGAQHQDGNLSPPVLGQRPDEPRSSPDTHRALGAVRDRDADGWVPEQQRRDQLARWSADDHAAETDGATDGDADGAVEGSPGAVREW